MTIRFLNSHHSTLYYLLAMAFTLVLVFVYDYLPEKRYTFMPGPLESIFSNDDRLGGGSNSNAGWHGNALWRCTVEANIYGAGCAFGVSFSKNPDDWTQGNDFSNYDAIMVDMDYKGPARLLRFHMRNFDENISSKEDYNSPKFNKINIRASDLKEIIRIELNEFQLADWWIEDYDIPRKWGQASFDRVTSFGVDLGSAPPPGTHEIRIHRIEFIGRHLSRSAWYLCILGTWMAIILLSLLLQNHAISRRSLMNKLRLKEMNAYAEGKKGPNNEDFEYKNQIDQLTSTYNRFGLQNITEAIFTRRRKSDRISLILVDLDHFKKVNEQFGYAMGDEALKEIAKVFLRNTRSFDSVSRWDDEEFVILCPQSSLDEAYSLAEKLRLKIKSLTFPGHPHLHLSATFGIIEVTENERFDDAMERANVALFSGKSAGRDCCIREE